MIQIFIKTPINPKTLCLRLDHKTTVSDLKHIIHRKLAIRPELQNLYTNNKRFKVLVYIIVILIYEPFTFCMISKWITVFYLTSGKGTRLDQELSQRLLNRRTNTGWLHNDGSYYILKKNYEKKKLICEDRTRIKPVLKTTEVIQAEMWEFKDPRS